MFAEALGQVHTATRTHKRSVVNEIHAKLLLPEALATCDTGRDRVTPAIPEEQHTFYSAQIAPSSAVGVNDLRVLKLNRIFKRD